MDIIDKQIIKLLKENCRMTNSEISKQTHLSIPAISERIKKLEGKGIIERFTVKLNRDKMGQSLVAFISVTLERTEYIPAFRKIIVQSEHVLECHHLAGEYDYLLKVAVQGTRGLEDFISNVLKGTEGVQKTSTTIALSTLKEEM
ncbi:Lrp/AsnC family transcriptional regulator [Chengkuizengella axinellae]|uniref:Lrp/AsnC family transcriptional regulator n=1 Tax=Chengkuizengella axinellae TaxID=3064388 RepID=A0ABT9IU79_9BACL|nr:Lrp/AsnC family transcriptional regulator [Chengkuizengella sp. 2205SS18-9]MDP5272920.1 Lrp/AsnC family transcriptional regulator [Chengkuizengella sp. 2205SS18-9]